MLNVRTAWVYCDKQTGDILVSRRGSVHLMNKKPALANIKNREYLYNTKVIVREVVVTFKEHFISKTSA